MSDRERLLQAARRWAGVVIAAILVGAVVAYALSSLAAPEYEATAQIYVAPASDPTSVFQDAAAGRWLAPSYVQLATTEVILRPVMEQQGWTGDLKSFRDRVSVSQIRNTLVIAVSFRATDPGTAARMANAIAERFIEKSTEVTASQVTLSLWQPATEPESPVSPRPLLNAAYGGSAGGVLAVAGVALFTYLRGSRS